MYILFTFDATNYTFQLKDEAGVDIGTPHVYAIADYKIPALTQKEDKYITVYPQDSQEGTFPWTAQFPRDRVVSY